LDFVVILLFILYIVFRSMGDRRRGMSREPVRKKPAPVEAAGKIRPQEKQVPLKRMLPEGESAYDQLVYMEGAEPEIKEEKVEKGEEAGPASPFYGESAGGSFAFMSGDDLRKAVIWSEILQKPRFRKPYRF
jgi:hypothetical protein